MPFDIYGEYVDETDEEILMRWEEEAARADEAYARSVYERCYLDVELHGGQPAGGGRKATLQ